MNLKTEQLIKSKLGLVLKVLLIALALFKLVDYCSREIQGSQEVEQKKNSIAIDATESETTSGHVEKGSVVKRGQSTNAKPLKNTASIYIFGPTGLDTQAERHLGSVYFDGYSIKGLPDGFEKEQLLMGNLSTSANTELVCVGTITYSYSKDEAQVSCELSLNFDAYDKVSGDRIAALSKSIVRYGIGFSNTQAKQVAWQKVNP